MMKELTLMKPVTVLVALYVRGAARVPARIDRLEPDGAGGVRELRAPQKRLVVHGLDVPRGDGGALVAGVDAQRIALPDVHGGFWARRARRAGPEHAENELALHGWAALGTRLPKQSPSQPG